MEHTEGRQGIYCSEGRGAVELGDFPDFAAAKIRLDEEAEAYTKKGIVVAWHRDRYITQFTAYPEGRHCKHFFIAPKGEEK